MVAGLTAMDMGYARLADTDDQMLDQAVGKRRKIAHKKNAMQWERERLASERRA